MLHNAIGAEFREVTDGVRDGKPVKVVVAARTYDTDVADLWDAVTNPERLPRWFAPATGDFKLGGRYQIEGNAGGTILRCEPPKLLDITWEFAGGMSWVVLNLTPDGDGARLTLEHIHRGEDLVGDHWKQFGPGAVGVGWDLSFMGLGMHLASGAGATAEEGMAWMMSEDGKAFVRASAASWGDAHVASGEDAKTARGMADRTAAFYAGG